MKLKEVDLIYEAFWAACAPDRRIGYRVRVRIMESELKAEEITDVLTSELEDRRDNETSQ